MNSRPDYEFEPENNRNDSVVKVGDWMVTILLLSLPFINIIYIIVLLISKSANRNKRNYVLASIIFVALTYVFAFGLIFGTFAIFGNAGGSIPQFGTNLIAFL